MGEDNIALTGPSPSSSMMTDEEQRLKERLNGKKEEARLRERLKAKRDSSRNRSNSEGDGSTSKDKNRSFSPTNQNNGDKQNSPHSESVSMSKNNGNERGRSRDRNGSNSRDRRSSSSQRFGRRPDSRGFSGPRYNDRGRGRPWGDRAGGYYEQDPYGRALPPGHYRGGPYDGPGGGYGGPPQHRRGSYYDDDRDQYGRARRPHYRNSRSRSRSYTSRSRSRSLSSASSRSRSRSRSPGPDDRRMKRERSENWRQEGRRNKHRRRRSRSPSTSGSSISSSSYSSSSDEESVAENGGKKDTNEDNFTKDQRTVFVNQLVMRTTAKDIRRYFRRKVGAKVNDISLLKDRRTGKHKGFAYVEMKSLEDVAKVLNVSGQAPDFQRFPILIKPSEAEKNYLIPASSATVTANMMGNKSNAKPLIGPNGQLIESQKVYVGSLDPSITQEHLFKLFSQFGDLTKVSLQMDPSSGISKGFAFLSFRDPKEANLAIQTMSNQVLCGRPMKTGWATIASGTPGYQVVTSDEFPEDASARAQKAHVALAQLAIGAGLTPSVTAGVVAAEASGQPAGVARIPTVAEARQSLATSVASGLMDCTSVASGLMDSVVSPPVVTAPVVSPDAKTIGRSENPSNHLLVQNMFDKDEETEEGWADEIKLEFQEECSKFGKIENVLVMSNDPGGKIYASFETIEAAKNCASSLAGRWFDKRQLRVEFVDEGQVPAHA